MSTQPFRLPRGGRIDRARPHRFIFNGRAYSGYAGDTLAAALLANGIHLVGRSFKYHRPRGIVTAGVEEPNALVQLGVGARSEPNLRATQCELYDGLIATSQNCWPSLRFDLGAINDRLARFLPAGFYYKTFMWPPSAWMQYEHAIRRMAGLGTAPEERDSDRYDKRLVHCDVLVVGAGPAGLAAALAAGRAGARVILADEQVEFGGSLLSGSAEIDGRPALDWVARATAELDWMAEAKLLRRATVFGYYDHNYLAIVERVADHLANPGEREPRQRLWKVRARQVVLATGAIERPLIFRDNDRPGIMLAGAARAYAHRYAAVPGRRTVVFTNNDSAYAAALDLIEAGGPVTTLIDIRAEPQGELADAVRAHGVEVIGGSAIVATSGRHRVKGVEVMRLTPDGTGVTGPVKYRDCDVVCMSGGWTPAVHLFSQSRGTLAYDSTHGCFVPSRAAQATHVAGICNGAWTLAECLRQGFTAGTAAARAAGFVEVAAAAAPPAPEPTATPPRILWVVPSDRAGTTSKHFVDFQNDVTVADIQLAAREGYRSVEHVKRYTTSGMGTDQGKLGNIPALGVLSDVLAADLPSLGTTTFRPPYTPVSFGALAGRDIDALADPIRVTPMHDWHVANGAIFEDVGQWKRPHFYPRAGETMRAAVDREVTAARTAVGILDASTLGKIDIQGPDAVTLLNRIYTNGWTTLEAARCRYGLMLKDDGMVMDDGVTTRLAPDHFHMTTTTGNAARVLGWLEEWVQTEWPDLRVYMASVTEQWAVATLSGPRARDVLAAAGTDLDLAPTAFPSQSMRQGAVAGMPARVFRVSFTGELSYEVNVPARCGGALWEALIAAGAPFGITPYGTEAMHVLRAEKGFIIVGQETDGTVTPLDLGLDRLVSKTKDFIGKRALLRPDTQRSDRKQLVGLLTEDPNEVLPEGAQIVVERRPEPPMPMIGHVTSSYFSPTLGRSIALALIVGGRARHGETLCVPLLGKTVKVEVAESCFYDRDGARANG